MTVLLVVLVILGAVVALFAVVRARSQGTEGSIMMRTEDDLESRAAATEIGELGREEGRPSGMAVAEPEGEPPVPGSQWDEVRGIWVHWDPASGSWVPSEAEPGQT